MGIDKLALSGAAFSAQARQPQTLAKQKSDVPALSVLGTYASPLSYQLVVKISSSARLTLSEKDGLIRNVAVVDEFAQTDTMRQRLLNSIAAVTSFMENSAGRGSDSLSEQQATQAVERAQAYYAKVRKQAQSGGATASDAEVQARIELQLQRYVEQHRHVSLEQASTAPRPEAANVAPVEPLTLPGQINDSLAQALPLPGQKTAQPLGQVVDVNIPGSQTVDYAKLQQLAANAEKAAKEQLAALQSSVAAPVRLPGDTTATNVQAQALLANKV